MLIKLKAALIREKISMTQMIQIITVMNLKNRFSTLKKVIRINKANSKTMKKDNHMMKKEKKNHMMMNLMTQMASVIQKKSSS